MKQVLQNRPNDIANEEASRCLGKGGGTDEVKACRVGEGEGGNGNAGSGELLERADEERDCDGEPYDGYNVPFSSG
jgi:hypothetical protein